MVQYEVTAELVTASASITINGLAQVVSVDVPVASTKTADTLVEAKQQARADVNYQTFLLIHQKIAEATLSTNQFVKGRLSTDYSIWQSVNITNIQTLLE